MRAGTANGSPTMQQRKQHWHENQQQFNQVRMRE